MVGANTGTIGGPAIATYTSTPASAIQPCSMATRRRRVPDADGIDAPMGANLRQATGGCQVN